MIFNKKENKCDGCKTYESEIESQKVFCRFAKFNQMGDCPCTNCLIKMVCIHGCIRIEEWTEMIDDRSKRKYR